jgi:hypothetical protein
LIRAGQWDVIKQLPRLADLWQLHYSEEGGAAHNTAEAFIANPQGLDAGNYIKLTVWKDRTFEVFNSRTKAIKHYAVPR